MSLYRLIRLAKKTGDRLIVHNETDSSNIVIMDLDNYERLVDFHDPEDVRGDFGGVSPWDPTPRPWDTPTGTAPSYPWEDNQDDCEVVDDEHDWSHIGDIMSSRYADIVPEREEILESIDDIPPFTPEEDTFEEERREEEVHQEAPQTVPEPVYESTTPSTPVVESPSVPSPSGASVAWQEESLPGDPVFYEESV